MGWWKLGGVGYWVFFGEKQCVLRWSTLFLVVYLCFGVASLAVCCLSLEWLCVFLMGLSAFLDFKMGKVDTVVSSSLHPFLKPNIFALGRDLNVSETRLDSDLGWVGCWGSASSKNIFWPNTLEQIPTNRN